MDPASKNRVRLWLRSERAMGAPSVPISEQFDETVLPEQSETPAQPASPAPSAMKSHPQPNPSPPPRNAAELFGAVAPAKSSGLMPPPSKEPFTSPVLATDEKRSRLQALDNNEVRGCT